MPRRRVLKQGLIATAALLLVAGALSTAGCSDKPGTTTSQPQATVTTADPASSTTTTGGKQPTTTSSASTTSVPSFPPSAALTLQQVRNAEITVGFEEGLLTVTLVDGRYEGPGGDNGSMVTVTMAEAAVFDDFDGDGAGDAAIAVTVDRAAQGGTGAGEPGAEQTSAYVVALLSQGSAPVQAGYHPVGLGARVDALGVNDGEIKVEAMVPGPEDPEGDPVVPLTATLRLPLSPGGNGLLLHTSQTTRTPAGDVREITITSPEWGAAVVYVGVVSGTVTISPFENNLAYTVYDPQMTELARGPLAVDAPDLGAPGTFELVLDLVTLGCWGEIFVTISDLSAADGSILALDSILLENFAPG